LNSRWDEEGNAIVVKRTLNVGIATDTARGLLVPVIHGADDLDLRAIATAASRLVSLARDGKLDAGSLTGGTITITNVGAAYPDPDVGAPRPRRSRRPAHQPAGGLCRRLRRHQAAPDRGRRPRRGAPRLLDLDLLRPPHRRGRYRRSVHGRARRRARTAGGVG